MREVHSVEPRPEVVTICGSMRFMDDMLRVAEILTKQNIIVIMPFVKKFTDSEKTKLDNLHKHKIAMSNRVVVVARNLYIGSSTAREIEYAYSMNIWVDIVDPAQKDLYTHVEQVNVNGNHVQLREDRGTNG